MNETPGPVLTTERLVLRPITTADLDEEHAMLSDPEVMRHISGGVPRERERVERSIEMSERRFAERGIGIFNVRTHDGAFVGDGLLVPIRRSGVPEERWRDDDAYGPEIEVGYRLARNAWGQGYATEIARALVHYAMEDEEGPRLASLVGVANPENEASMRVLEKAGLTHVGLTDAYYDTYTTLYATDPSSFATVPDWALRGWMSPYQLGLVAWAAGLCGTSLIGGGMAGMSPTPGSQIDWITGTIEGLKLLGIGVVCTLPGMAVFWLEGPQRWVRRSLGPKIATAGHYLACLAHPMGLLILLGTWKLRFVRRRGWYFPYINQLTSALFFVLCLLMIGATLLTVELVLPWSLGIVAPFGVVGLAVYLFRRGRVQP